MKNTNKGNTNKGNANKGNTNKKTVLESLASYQNYVDNNNPYIVPTKGINSGSDGRLYERKVKTALRNYKGAMHISKATQQDTIKKLDGVFSSFEIKQGCGTIANITEEGTLYGSMLNSDYVIYCPQYNRALPIVTQAYILPTLDFIDILKDIGLIRYKYSGNQYCNGERKTNAFYDRLTIQTFKNSKRKTELLYDNLNKYADNLYTFFKRYNVVIDITI